MFTFKVLKVIAEIGSSEKYKKRLTLMQWQKNIAKLDVRQWHTDKNGEEQPAKGVTLSYAEAQRLADALNKYLAETPPPTANENG